MRPRLAILTMLAVGILFMGAGTGLAVSGISGNDDASEAVYPTTTTYDHRLPRHYSPAGGGGRRDWRRHWWAAGSTEPRRRKSLRSRRAATDSLPFTGFAAIP